MRTLAASLTLLILSFSISNANSQICNENEDYNESESLTIQITECVTVNYENLSFQVNIADKNYMLNFYINPQDRDGVYWKVADEIGNNCIFSTEKLKILCARYGEYIFAFDLLADPYSAGTVWKLELESFRQGSSPYSIEEVNIGSVIKEHRLYCYNNYSNKHHFLTIIEDNGAVIVRPHPGVDPDGWGSSLYLQPFLPGAFLRNTHITRIAANDNGVDVVISGKVSRGATSSYGNFTVSLFFTYDPPKKKIYAKGQYDINLDGKLYSASDLNLYKISSNVLLTVPLLSGGIGNTGDMSKVLICGDDFNYTWTPSLTTPAYFPNDITNKLSVSVIGALNEVDTKSQGYEPIKKAYKPTLKMLISSKLPREEKMIFGAIYNTSQSSFFFSDNVGITPLILKSSNETRFSFDIEFESEALPDDSLNYSNH